MSLIQDDSTPLNAKHGAQILVLPCHNLVCCHHDVVGAKVLALGLPVVAVVHANGQLMAGHLGFHFALPLTQQAGRAHHQSATLVG